MDGVGVDGLRCSVHTAEVRLEKREGNSASLQTSNYSFKLSDGRRVMAKRGDGEHKRSTADEKQILEILKYENKRYFFSHSAGPDHKLITSFGLSHLYCLSLMLFKHVLPCY